MTQEPQDSMVEIRKRLFEAVTGGNFKTVEALAKSYLDVLKGPWSGKRGRGYLHLAASVGQLEVCRALVAAGIPVDVPEVGGSDDVPLSVAALNKHPAIVSWLLNQGAVVDGLPTSVATPLMGAAVAGSMEIAMLLLDAGAEINREHLTLPQTALDFAVFYSVTKTGQDAVAALLRSRGGIRPYTEKHDWNGVHGQRYIEHVERAVGSFVNPLPTSAVSLGKSREVRILKVRIPRKYDFQLLFTVGLFPTRSELAVCLPSRWPLNGQSLKLPEYRWPVQLLTDLARASLKGAKIDHGAVFQSDDPFFAAAAGHQPPSQWLVAKSQTFEGERDDDDLIARTFFVVPVSRGAIKSGPQAMALADKRSKEKWAKWALASLVHNQR